MGQKTAEPSAPAEDPRPFWKRVIASLRPTANVETDKKTGQKITTIGVKGGAEF